MLRICLKILHSVLYACSAQNTLNLSNIIVQYGTLRISVQNYNVIKYYIIILSNDFITMIPCTGSS
jgi:hypothetical protein